MKICVAGQGAFGIKHLEAIAKIDGIEVVSLAGGNPAGTEEVARKFGIPHWTSDLAESLKQPGVEAAILTTPTQMHAAQGEQCMRAGKHVMIEIPIADTLRDSERLVRVQKETGLIAMGGHTRRFNPSHQWIRKRILSGELKIQSMDVQTFFFRRTNMNAAGQTICCGTTPAIPSICSSIRPAKSLTAPMRCRVRFTPSSGSRWT